MVRGYAPAAPRGSNGTAMRIHIDITHHHTLQIEVEAASETDALIIARAWAENEQASGRGIRVIDSVRSPFAYMCAYRDGATGSR
jgi:hypothetical protein